MVNDDLVVAARGRLSNPIGKAPALIDEADPGASVTDQPALGRHLSPRQQRDRESEHGGRDHRPTRQAHWGTVTVMMMVVGSTRSPPDSTGGKIAWLPRGEIGKPFRRSTTTALACVACTVAALACWVGAGGIDALCTAFKCASAALNPGSSPAAWRYSCAAAL